MKLATVITNLKTFLEGLEWTSDSGTTDPEDPQKTKLQAVYTAPKYEGVAGFPYACVYEGETAFSTIDNMTYEATTRITVDICVNYDIIELQDEDLKREEALVRVREAWDYIKTQLFKFSTESTLGILLQKDPRADTNMDLDTKLYKKTITMFVSEDISKV